MKSKLTEDQTVLLLIDFLKQKGYEIESYCLGHQRGYDIVSSLNDEKLIIEVKGARANDNSPIKKRKFFDSGQLKDHLGKAIVKSIETINEVKGAKVAIAHPDDEYIRKIIGKITPKLKQMSILHIWVSEDGEVKFD